MMVKTAMPTVSFGIPVRNAEEHIEKLLGSILDQTFQDFEIVVADNVSTDKTRDILDAYRASDSRIRCVFNDSNIGQIENFNLVFRLSRGKYFRWIGADDWIEPRYTEECVELMEKDESIMGVTTYTVMHQEGGIEHRFEYKGERLESADATRRFTRMMWLLRKGLMYSSPISAFFRRTALEQTNLFQIVPDTDRVMAAEISLIGKQGHIPKHYVHRRRPMTPPTRMHEMYKRYHPTRYKEVEHSFFKSCKKIAAMIWDTDLKFRQKVQCSLGLGVFFVANYPREIAQRMKRIVIHRLPEETKIKKALDKRKPYAG